MDNIPSHVPRDRVVDVDLYNVPGSREDFHGAWLKMQQENQGVVWTPRNGGHWIALRADIIRTALSDYNYFSARTIQVPAERSKELQVLPTSLDPPRHGLYRAIINPPLSPKAVKTIESFIRDTAISLIEGFRASGQCEFVKDFAEHLPIRVFLTLCNLPIADADGLKELASGVGRLDETMSVADRMEGLQAYLKPYLAARRASPGSDVLSVITNAQVSGALISEEDAMDMSVQLLIAGLDTVVNFLSYSVAFLAENPGHVRALVEDRSKIPAAVDELLRRLGLITPAREIVMDYDYDSVTLKRGDIIVIPTQLAGLDSRDHEDPIKVDFARANKQNCAFGYGNHRCAGSFLAKIEAKIFLEEWTQRIPEFRLREGEQLRFNSGIAASIDAVHLVWPQPPKPPGQ